MTQAEHPQTPSDEDWPHCKRCGAYEWEHADADHPMKWPALTAREIRVADRIMEALR